MSKIMPIVLHPHPALTQKAQPVAEVNDDIRAILDDMLATMYQAQTGVGLAANQVNILKRLVVMDMGVARKDGSRDYSVRRPQFFVNPEIVWSSPETVCQTEGCLSLPDLWGDVERPARVKVVYLDRDGVRHEDEAEGLYAVCIQHEIDHLNGVIFPQRMSRLRREMAEKRYTRKRKEWLQDPVYDSLTQEQGVVKAAPHAGKM